LFCGSSTPKSSRIKTGCSFVGTDAKTKQEILLDCPKPYLIRKNDFAVPITGKYEIALESI